MKRINYQVTVNGTSTDASETINILATEKSNANITGYTVEYQDDRETIILHIWRDFSDGEEPATHYDKMNAALSNLPVSVPRGAESGVITHSDRADK